MTIIRHALKQASWLAVFRIISQALSWAATIIVARLLVPDDYGLMELATILTGYVALFSELGLGAAIVQKEDISNQELSSLHWLMVFWGIVLSCSCFLLAKPTVWLFGNEDTYYITMLCALVYPFASLVIVPRNLLNREMRFKAIGIIEAGTTIVSCLSMVIMAYGGAGVWTLVVGTIIRTIARAFLTFRFVSWRPSFHFSIKDTIPYLGFGVNIAIANSLNYISVKSDRFFAGKFMKVTGVGHYALSLQLSSMPNEKIVALINSIAFPVLSRFQTQPKESRLFFLSLLQGIAFLTGPLFFGLAAVADNAVLVLVGWQWHDAIFPLRLLCIGQYFIALSTASDVANMAQGRPKWNLYFNIINVAVIPLSFWGAAHWGINGLAVPWVTIIPLNRLIYSLLTAKKMDITIRRLAHTLLHPSLATSLMLIVVITLKNTLSPNQNSNLMLLLYQITAGGLTFATYLFFIRKKLKITINSLLEIKTQT